MAEYGIAKTPKGFLLIVYGKGSRYLGFFEGMAWRIFRREPDLWVL